VIDSIDTDEIEPDDDGPLAQDTRSQPLRYSVLKLMAQSPAHARHAMLRQGDGASLALRIGSATHAMTFEDRPVVAYTGKARRGKEWDEFQAAHASDIIVNAKEYAQSRGMADAIRANEIAARVLFAPKAIREQRIDWTWAGRSWRSTPDAYEFRTLAELKTTRCADPEKFKWDALRMGYHVQAALYKRAIFETTGIKIRDAYLFAVESVPPYVVTPFRFSERSLEHGDMLARRWHEQFLECEMTGVWPGYATGIAELDVFEQEDESVMEVERAMDADDGARASVAF
jgi:hypothetical protein